MAIPLTCSCGKTFKVMDEQAGRKVRCPTCQEMVRVPGKVAEEAEDGYGMESTKKCPGCKREVAGDAVVCVDCGYNFHKGKRMETVYQVIDRTVDLGVTWLGCYTRLTIVRNRKGRTTLTIAKRFLFIPLFKQEIDLSKYKAVTIDCSLGNPDPESPAPDVYYLELQGPRSRPVRILRTTNEWKMREVVDTLAEAARLEIKRA